MISRLARVHRLSSTLTIIVPVAAHISSLAPSVPATDLSRIAALHLLRRNALHPQEPNAQIAESWLRNVGTAGRIRLEGENAAPQRERSNPAAKLDLLALRDNHNPGIDIETPECAQAVADACGQGRASPRMKYSRIHGKNHTPAELNDRSILGAQLCARSFGPPRPGWARISPSRQTWSASRTRQCHRPARSCCDEVA